MRHRPTHRPTITVAALLVLATAPAHAQATDPQVRDDLQAIYAMWTFVDSTANVCFSASNYEVNYMAAAEDWKAHNIPLRDYADKVLLASGGTEEWRTQAEAAGSLIAQNLAKSEDAALGCQNWLRKMNAGDYELETYLSQQLRRLRAAFPR